MALVAHNADNNCNATNNPGDDDSDSSSGCHYDDDDVAAITVERGDIMGEKVDGIGMVGLWRKLQRQKVILKASKNKSELQRR